MSGQLHASASLFLLDIMLGDVQRRSGHTGEEKKYLSLKRISNSRCPDDV